MKRSTLALASLATLALSTTFATPALAQSSVTLFGVLDVAARQVKNNASQSRLDSSGLSSSRLGFRGTEDLGGGLRAHFWVEGALTVDDGTASGQTWQRRSTVGLQGGFGEVRLGREKNPSGLAWEQADPFGDTGMGAVGRFNQLAGLLPAGGVNNSFSRTSNQISYYTPGSGFFLHGAVAAGEGTLGNKHLGLRVGYRAGPILASIAYGGTEVTTATDLKRTTFGASYDLKTVKLFGMFAKTDAGANDQDNYLLGISMPLGRFDLRASYNKVDGNGAFSSRSATGYALGSAYTLSRRTAVYATVAQINNKGASNLTVATGTALSPGRKSSGYEVGVRHSF